MQRQQISDGPRQSGRPDEARLKEDDTKSTVERWEKCLRKQISTHPRIALGLGLVTGIALGCWVKR